MAAVEVAKLTPNELAELACTYAALILHDDQQDITAAKISALITASGVKIEPYWPKLFAKAVEGKDISSLFNFSGPAAPAATAPVKQEKKKEEKKEQKKEDKKAKPAEKAPEPEEADGDMGGLFD